MANLKSKMHNKFVEYPIYQWFLEMTIAKIYWHRYHGFMKTCTGFGDASFLQPRKYLQKQKNWMIITTEFNLNKLYFYIN